MRVVERVTWLGSWQRQLHQRSEAFVAGKAFSDGVLGRDDKAVRSVADTVLFGNVVHKYIGRTVLVTLLHLLLIFRTISRSPYPYIQLSLPHFCQWKPVRLLPVLTIEARSVRPRQNRTNVTNSTFSILISCSLRLSVASSIKSAYVPLMLRRAMPL